LDLVLTVVFSGCAILAVAGALAAGLAPVPSWRPLGLLAVAVGASGLLLSLSATLAAPTALVALGGIALMAAGGEPGPAPRAAAPPRAAVAGLTAPVQVGVAGVVLLLAVLLVIAFGGQFAAGAGGGSFASAGRVLFARDALAAEAVGASLLVALAAGAAAWSRRS
jgi:hypothetical protein